MKQFWSVLFYGCLAAFILGSTGCKKQQTPVPAQAPEKVTKEIKTDLGKNKLLIDDLEGEISSDNGCGNGAECTITFLSRQDHPDDVYTGLQAMQITYDKTYGGYLYCARGFGLKPAMEIPEEKLIWSIRPEKIDFQKYNAFGFYFKGDNTGNTIAVDLLDKDREIFRHEFSDDSSEWKEITVPFAQFKQRSDYQPDWNKSNKVLDFPVVTYQFEPLTGTGKEIKGDIIIDAVHFAVVEADTMKAPSEKALKDDLTEKMSSEKEKAISPDILKKTAPDGLDLPDKLKY